jgi:hypothetical protein
MTKSEIFKKAHAMAKSILNIFKKYRDAFSAALTKVYEQSRKPKIEKVHVFWSESRRFNDETTYSYEEYTAIAKQVAIDNGTDGGYFKTKINIFYTDGTEYGLRHDIGCDATILEQRMHDYAQYALSDEAPSWMKPEGELEKFYKALVA